jgi:hypothetical protein
MWSIWSEGGLLPTMAMLELNLWSDPKYCCAGVNLWSETNGSHAE